MNNMAFRFSSSHHHSSSATTKLPAALGTNFMIRLDRYPIFIFMCQFFFFHFHCLPINEKFHSRSDKNWREAGGLSGGDLRPKHSRHTTKIEKRTRHWFLFIFLLEAAEKFAYRFAFGWFFFLLSLKLNIAIPPSACLWNGWSCFSETPTTWVEEKWIRIEKKPKKIFLPYQSM